jgi:hypothetical protein
MCLEIAPHVAEPVASNTLDNLHTTLLVARLSIRIKGTGHPPPSSSRGTSRAQGQPETQCDAKPVTKHSTNVAGLRYLHGCR